MNTIPILSKELIEMDPKEFLDYFKRLNVYLDTHEKDRIVYIDYKLLDEN
jgi:hypothetical protein